MGRMGRPFYKRSWNFFCCGTRGTTIFKEGIENSAMGRVGRLFYKRSLKFPYGTRGTTISQKSMKIHAMGRVGRVFSKKALNISLWDIWTGVLQEGIKLLSVTKLGQTNSISQFSILIRHPTTTVKWNSFSLMVPRIHPCMVNTSFQPFDDCLVESMCLPWAHSQDPDLMTSRLH